MFLCVSKDNASLLSLPLPAPLWECTTVQVPMQGCCVYTCLGMRQALAAYEGHENKGIEYENLSSGKAMYDV